MDLPCITAGELKAKLANVPDSAKVLAWAPGSYLPVACAALAGDRFLLEINVPDDAALSR
jgi:hypothetical protein